MILCCMMLKFARMSCWATPPFTFADALDISDTSYSAVLVDDLDNDGQLELLVATMSGHLYAIATPGEYHPLKTWPQQVPGISNFVARHDQVSFSHMQCMECQESVSTALHISAFNGSSLCVYLDQFTGLFNCNGSSVAMVSFCIERSRVCVRFLSSLISM
jgi:hypothetical protein